MSEWIEQDCRDENHLYIHLKDPRLLDLSIFERLSNDDFCLPCMLTYEKTASMVYATEGYIPLDDFLSQYVFEKEEGYVFLHQLFEQAIASNRNKPVLFDPDYVFVTPYGDKFAFVVIPIQVSNWMFQKDMSEKWVEYIAKTMQTTTAFEIPGFLLKFLKSAEFSLPNLVLGLDNIRTIYYPKKFSLFRNKRMQTFKVKEPIQAFHKDKSVESIQEEKTQLLQVHVAFKASLIWNKEEYALCNEINIVGRAMVFDVRFQDASVSLKHAKIVCENERYYIQDLKSTNKTYLNGKEVKRKMRLKDGMQVQFGDIVCEFKE